MPRSIPAIKQVFGPGLALTSHMIITGNTYLSTIVLLCALASLAYVGLAVRATLAFKRKSASAGPDSMPVTILKPVCGMEVNLYQNLRSFCTQDYPRYQVIFGVSSATDPALEVIHRLIEEFPDRELELVIDARLIGTNHKVSNLANMYPVAHYDLLVIADSDMLVEPDYLATVAACFDDPEVAVATCLYTGKPDEGLASSLGASFINKWFLPSVLVALSFQKLSFCFGATMAVRRERLAAIGGFERLASVLADDYMLGNLISEQGYKVALVPYLVRNIVHEPSMQALFRHELRWARTVRSVQPIGYSMSFLTHAIPMALLYLAVTPSPGLGFSVLGLAVIMRLMMHYAARSHLALDAPSQVWLEPIRDLMCFAIWLASFFGRNVDWRQHSFTIQDSGQMTQKESKTI